MSETSKKILIVEDEIALSDIFSVVLEKGGYQVIRAMDGVAGLEAAIRELPDLVLLDLAMPLKNGFEVLTDLRGNAKTRNLPVIILSNLGQDYEIKRGLRLGAQKYFIKTNVTPDLLLREVGETLAGIRPAGGKTGPRQPV